MLVSKLKKRLDSYRFGLPTLTLQAERKQYEVESGDIDAVNWKQKGKWHILIALQLVIKLKNHLKVFKSAQSIPIDTTPQLAHQFKEHLGMHLANKLAFQFERYQMLRKMFHAILYDRQMRFKEVVKQESKAERDVEAHIDVKFTGDEGGLDASSIMPLQQQAVLDETDQNMLKERDQEIDQVVQDVSYITDVMNQIQVMTIEQGTLLDRIDVNLDSTRHNLSKAIGNLEKRAERFSVYQKRLILFCLTLMIFITSLAIFFKR